MNRKILVVVDMQNDFIHGPLGSEEARKAAVNAKEKLEKYGTEYERVIFTHDTHFEDYFDTLEGKRLPVKHCSYGTEGWMLCREVAWNLIDNSKSSYICKTIFGCERLVRLLNETVLDSSDEIELIGVCTDICVVSNALMIRSAFPNNVIKVDASCCAGTSVEAHEAALKVMQSCMIDII